MGRVRVQGPRNRVFGRSRGCGLFSALRAELPAVKAVDETRSGPIIAADESVRRHYCVLWRGGAGVVAFALAIA